MAARSHVDSGINERRLRPIYDYLDNGNNKKALQEAEKLIKKQKDTKDNLCAQALKALALIRLTRQDEALIVIKDVHSKGPTDDATLQVMTLCYREIQKPELIAEAYENATKKDPQNEELLTHLFMSYVRNGEYKRQQQTALNLYKLKPKNPYYFWAVMSIVMQARHEDEKLAKTMLLPLADRMAVKFVNEDKIEAEAEVELYLMILEMQEKYKEAFDVLEGPLKDKLSGYLDYLPKKQAELLSKMKKWPEATIAFKKLIFSNPDQWSYYMEYFEVLTHLVDSSWEPEEKIPSDIDYTFQHAIDLLDKLTDDQNSATDSRILRGPYLAQIELLRQLIVRKDPLASKIGTLVDKITAFYKIFSSKPCCYMDIAHILSSVTLTEEEINTFLVNIKGILSETTDNSYAKDMNSLYKHLCYAQLCLYLGHHDNWSDEQKLTYVEELNDHYKSGLELGSKLLLTEFQPCDNYCLLSAYVLINLWQKSGNETYILQIISSLEEGLKRSPYNFQMKLLLIKLYNVIGAVGVSYSFYESIDIKHIQQETLGYLIMEPLLAGAFFGNSTSMLSSSIRFFIGNYKDTVDYLISCYKFGSFTKIPEIVNFRRKLNDSLNYAFVKVEKLILNLLMYTKNQQDAERVINSMEIDQLKDTLEDATDNRDISIFRQWSFKDKVITDERVAKTFKEMITWVRIRNIMVKSIFALHNLTKSTLHINNSLHNDLANGEKPVPDSLNDLLSSLKDIVDSVNVDDLISSNFPLQAPGPNRLLRYIQGSHLDIFISLLELVLNVQRLAESSADAEEKSCLKIISDSKKLFQALLKKMDSTISSNQDNTKPTQVKIILEDFTNSVESFSLGTILIGLSHTLLKPTRNTAMRKGKKKKDNVLRIATEVFQKLDTLISTMENVAEGLLEILSKMDLHLLTSRLGTMSLCDNKILEDTSGQPPCEGQMETEEKSKDVTKKVLSSYQDSIFELKHILQIKQKYLQSLKW